MMAQTDLGGRLRQDDCELEDSFGCIVPSDRNPGQEESQCWRHRKKMTSFRGLEKGIVGVCFTGTEFLCRNKARDGWWW